MNPIFFPRNILMSKKGIINDHLVFHHPSIERRVSLYYVIMGSVERLTGLPLCSLLLL